MKVTKRIITVLLCAAMLLSVMCAGFAAYAQTESKWGKFTEADFLKANGKYVRNNAGYGNVVYLRGTNAGGWLLQESWMCPSNASCQQQIIDTFTNRFGESVCNELIDIYKDNYWTEADFDNCASLGMSVIRLPFWYRDLLNNDYSLRSDAFERLDWFVENAAERGIYTILDMHGAPGSQNGSDHSGVDGGDAKQAASQFFFGDNAAANQQAYYTLWEKIAEHYKGNPAVAGYDLLNEPFCTYRYSSGYTDTYLHNLLWGIYDTAYDRIRAVDPDHMLIMEATWDASDLPDPSDYGWSNVMYEYHNYNYGDYDNAEGEQITSMQNKINGITTADYDVPSYIGEFCYFNNASAWTTGLNLLNNNNLNWTSWSYKVLSSYGNWGIYNHNPSSVDIYNDSADTIRQKWSTVGASNAWLNTNISSIVSSHLPGTSNGAASLNGTALMGIKSESTGKYTCAENYGASPLVADRSSCSGWEQFIIIDNGDGTVAFMSYVNGKYICAVIDESNQLLCRSAKISTWEKFTLQSLGGDKYAIKAGANGLYVAVDSSDNVLKATASSVTTAATFTIAQSDTIMYSIEQPQSEQEEQETETVADAYLFKVGSVNGYWTTYDYSFTSAVACQFVGGVTYVPFRIIADAAGAKNVSFDSSAGTVTITNKYDMVFVLTMDSTACTVTYNGETQSTSLNAAPMFIDGQCCLPIRDVSNITYASVTYTEQQNDAYVVVSAAALTESETAKCIAMFK